MNALKFSPGQNGSSQVRRSAGVRAGHRRPAPAGQLVQAEIQLVVAGGQSGRHGDRERRVVAVRAPAPWRLLRRGRVRAGRLALASPEDPREAEVEHLHASRERHHDVRGLQVAVDDAVRVRLGERARHREDDAERLVRPERTVEEKPVG